MAFLITLVGAAVDWGLAFLVSHVAQNAVRDGARVAVTQISVSSAAIKTEVNSRIPDTPLFTDFRNTSNILVFCAMSGSTPFITVQTSGNFNFFFLRMVGFSAPITISRAATMRYERGLICPVIT
jgi:hypothetical protein